MAVPPLGQPGLVSRLRVLIVEDDPVSSLLLRKSLETRNYEVDQAATGLEALQILQEGRHRIVITDWMMPEMDGVELCRRIRAMRGAYVYVILLSAKSNRDDRLVGFEAGVDDFLSKPLDRDELYARLKVAQRILDGEVALQNQKVELEKAGEALRGLNNTLTIASRRFEDLFSNLPVSCFTFDSDGVVHDWNQASNGLFLLGGHQTMTHPIFVVFGPGDIDGLWTPELVQRVFEGEVLTDLEWKFQRDDGSERSIVSSIFPISGAGSEVLGAISANIDITERKMAQMQIEEQMLQINEIAYNLELQKQALEEANEKLELLAVTDGLTGLWNHRRAREELELRYAEHVRMKKPFSIVMIDVDHFKQYNDTFGHPAGDEVLKEVARILKETARKHESVARYGGEEFFIILPDTDTEGAVQAAERFRVAVENGSWRLRAITASIGVATTEDGVHSGSELLKNADDALYASKQAGRNRVTHHRQLVNQASAA